MERAPMSPREKLIPWRMTPETYEQAVFWFKVAAEADYLSDQWHAATEAIQSLPGYPLEYAAEEGQILMPDIIDKISSSVLH